MKNTLLICAVLLISLSFAQEIEINDKYPCINSLEVPEELVINEDGTDDGLKIYLNCQVEAFEFTIFNRWGEAIFVAHDQSFSWDVKMDNGELYPAALYFWTIKFKADGENVEKSGKFNLIY
ncbi:MAG: gliding motility-associated C-terminal domain-containing protein [Crocinitomicaceae bacterium]